MKINNSIGPNIQSLENSKSKALDGNSKAKPEGAKSSQDLEGSSNVKLSERAQMMSKAKDIAANSGDIDESKVSRLQKLIDEGKYNINASAIADKLVDEHMMLPTE